MYYNDAGAFPTAALGLGVLQRPVMRGPYLNKSMSLRDPWGRAYGYAFGADGLPIVTTLGRDGVQGGTGEDADLSAEPSPR